MATRLDSATQKICDTDPEKAFFQGVDNAEVRSLYFELQNGGVDALNVVSDKALNGLSTLPSNPNDLSQPEIIIAENCPTSHLEPLLPTALFESRRSQPQYHAATSPPSRNVEPRLAALPPVVHVDPTQDEPTQEFYRRSTVTPSQQPVPLEEMSPERRAIFTQPEGPFAARMYQEAPQKPMGADLLRATPLEDIPDYWSEF